MPKAEIVEQAKVQQARGESIPASGPERKRRMSEIIARIAEEDRDILTQLAR